MEASSILNIAPSMMKDGFEHKWKGVGTSSFGQVIIPLDGLIGSKEHCLWCPSAMSGKDLWAAWLSDRRYADVDVESRLDGQWPASDEGILIAGTGVTAGPGFLWSNEVEGRSGEFPARAAVIEGMLLPEYPYGDMTKSVMAAARPQPQPTTAKQANITADSPGDRSEPTAEFTPSRALAHYLIRAWRRMSDDTARLRTDLGPDFTIPLSVFEGYSDAELYKHAEEQLANIVRDLLAAVASVFQLSLVSRTKEKASASVHLTERGNFRPFVAPLIARHFPISADEEYGFLRLLVRELGAVAKTGGYGGPWGCLTVSPDSELVLTVSRPEDGPPVTPRRRARRVRWLSEKS